MILFFLLSIWGSGCSPRVSQSGVNLLVALSADGQTRTISVSAGSKIQQVLESAGIQLGSLDKVDPQAYTVVTEGLSIKVTRGREVFETKKSVIPFERQTVGNESLPTGETRLLQPGVNGTQEIVYRTYYEDDKLVSTSISRS